MSINSSAAPEKTYHYVITESGLPSSLDPLDADNTNNLPVARMIYATPIEVTIDNQLASRVLDSFIYDAATKTIHWVVKTGLKFSDGSPISPNDVAFAVARMAFTRPSFPVLENIVGIKKWAHSKSALKSFPEGIQIKGQKISILLDRKTDHPLFRFCLELFSIVPKSCVDPEKNTIACKEIPTSGPYRIAEKSDSAYLFIGHNDEPTDSFPSRIRFEYVLPQDLIKKIAGFDSLTVVSGSEVSSSVSDLKFIEEKLTTKFTPASRFSSLLLNSEVGAFRDKKCRQYFSQEFRKSYSELADKPQPLEASIFAKVLPGYLSVHDLDGGALLSNEDLAKCRAVFSKTEISWGYAPGKGNTVFVNALKQATHKTGARLAAPILTASRQESEDLFSAGKISVLNGSSGFWALDPAGDMKMLLTPNLHKTLRFTASDHVLQKLISELADEPIDFVKVNRRIFEEATLNVYTHLRRFFAATSKTALADFPFAISSPAPWQVFRNE